MGNIVLLDELTINQIAAGEVIERPASVIKEMVENSIDAGANSITVEVKNGGISYIRVVDNGKGINADDMELAFERHATSKIRSAEDLNRVTSMGFRGEALASIAAIANVEMLSKTAESPVGNRIVVEGGKILEQEETGCTNGTTITVENLFYNTPVRYKFLKKDYTESGYIEDVITRLALVNPNISFKLINSGKTVIQTNGNGNMQDVIYSIYGKDVATAVLPVDYQYEDVHITGVVGKPEIARSNRSNQMFFVNKRYVKDKTLSGATENSFKGLLPIGKYGFLVLNLEMLPNRVDVNVHPAKLEVRFQDENIVFKAVYHAIKDTLLKSELVANADRNMELDGIKQTKFENKEQKEPKAAVNGIASLFRKIADSQEKERAIQENENNIIQDIYNRNIAQEQVRATPNNAFNLNIAEPTVNKENISNNPFNIPNMVDYTNSMNNIIQTPVTNNVEIQTPQVTNNVDMPKNNDLNNINNNENLDQITNNIDLNLTQHEDMFEKLMEIQKNLRVEKTATPTIQTITTEPPLEINEEEQQNEIYNNNNNIPTQEDNISSQENMSVNEPIPQKTSPEFANMYEKTFGKLPATTLEEKKEEEKKINAYDIVQDNNISVFENIEQYNKPKYKFVGVVFKTYIILEIENEMYILDQHAAHERIMYEKVKANYYADENKDSQLLLLPDIITLSHKEMSIARENMDMFQQAGFVLEEFGENTIKLNGVPNICLNLDTKELFLETLDEINTVARTAKQEIEEKFIATVACKAAVKANMALTPEEVDNLMEELLKLPNPFTCPHGRPTAIKMDKSDIEKKFARRK